MNSSNATKERKHWVCKTKVESDSDFDMLTVGCISSKWHQISFWSCMFHSIKPVFNSWQTGFSGYALGMFLMGIDLPLFSKPCGQKYVLSYLEPLSKFLLKEVFYIMGNKSIIDYGV